MPRPNQPPALTVVHCGQCGRQRPASPSHLARSLGEVFPAFALHGITPACCSAAGIEKTAEAVGLAYLPTWSIETAASSHLAPTFQKRIARGPIGWYGPRLFEVVARVLAWAPDVDCRKAWGGGLPYNPTGVAENDKGGVAEWVATLTDERAAVLLAAHDLAGEDAQAVGAAVLALLNTWCAVLPRRARSRGAA